ncbi:immunity 22 family protein [Montanilutibacter psychrotolerans]|uniref:Immunity protein 22 n=1 Tax=Montanilutibacter psychrotolerans TaxID=1327343 RepID=A0A3M8T2N0_9GAMM|nr:immunity 22 family protein [Lysobacter psychrotolerans]RNF85012.1 hypothetical protein EER27_04270 [Lysobacter psychrotolerans]
MDITPPAPNRKIHVWIGTSEQRDDDAWHSYFDLEGRGCACGFCRDTGVEWFDFDFFSSHYAGDIVDVQQVIGVVPYSDQFDVEINAACEAHGIAQANACFTMVDFDGTTRVGQRYNDLVLVGVFGFAA